MPSLLGTTVATNYGKMTSQQTYGVGESFTNFGTRQLQVIKVLVSGTGTDFTKADGVNGSNNYGTTANSLFSLAVRSLQQYMEVYAVYAPVATGFIAIVAFDTANTADSGNGGAIGSGNVVNFANNGLAEAGIKAAIDVAGNAGAGTTSTITITAPTVAIGTTL